MTNSSSDVMIWVKEEGFEGAAFTVFVRPNAIVDHLKDAIEKKQKFTYASSRLTIKVKAGETFEAQNPRKLVSEVVKEIADEDFIYFTQPALTSEGNIYNT